MALKKCFLLFLGDKSTNHINAIKKSMDSYFGYNICINSFYIYAYIVYIL
jgi:hypothetical protein